MTFEEFRSRIGQLSQYSRCLTKLTQSPTGNSYANFYGWKIKLESRGIYDPKDGVNKSIEVSLSNQDGKRNITRNIWLDHIDKIKLIEIGKSEILSFKCKGRHIDLSDEDFKSYPCEWIIRIYSDNLSETWETDIYEI